MDSTEARALLACDLALEEALGHARPLDEKLRQIVQDAHERIHDARLDADEWELQRTLKAMHSPETPIDSP